MCLCTCERDNLYDGVPVRLLRIVLVKNRLAKSIAYQVRINEGVSAKQLSCSLSNPPPAGGGRKTHPGTTKTSFST